jgi:2-C-methyl-D-erythritol 4-phosphate cytidylyltransferase
MPLFDTYIIIVAAGSGSRFGSDTPKQFCLLNGQPVVMHAINNLKQAFPSSEIILVISPAEAKRWDELCARYDFVTPRIAFGGATRWESVKNGLAEIPHDANPNSVVLIHDGARPLIDTATAKRVAGAAFNTDGAIPTIDVSDSLRKLGDDGVSSEAVDRSQYQAVQTPQGFSLWRLRQAYSLPYQKTFTDDASVMAEAGFDNIFLVKGNPDNIKITNPRDIAIAEAILSLSK